MWPAAIGGSDEEMKMENNLREIESSDLEDLFEIHSDILVHEFLEPTPSKEEFERNMARYFSIRSKIPYGLIGIISNEEKKVIGYLGVQPLKNYGLELFFGLNSKYWGKGICRNAVRSYLDNHLSELEQIFATVHPQNVRSMKVLEKTGFLFQKDIYYEPQKKDHRLYLLKRNAARLQL